MPATPAALCNLALLRIGQRQLLDDLTDDTPQGQACNALYQHAEDLVRQAFPWPFCTRRAELNLLTDVERDGWDYVYAAPTDMAAPQYLYAGTRAPAATELAFAIEDGNGDTTGRIILTDEEDALLVYTTDEVPIALWPALVQDALAWKLAADLAMALPVEPGRAAQAEQRYEQVLAKAAAQELGRRMADDPLEAEAVRVR